MTNGPFEIDIDTLGNLRPISKVVFSLGSNMGEPDEILSEAIQHLGDTPDLMLVDISPVYQTKPVGDVEQDDFLNLVVIAESTLEPLTILDRVHAIEEHFGRERLIPGGPRTLDIDLILVGRHSSQPGLDLPHPRAHERAFVLVPWLDVEPNAELPEYGPIAELVEDVDLTGVIRRDDIVIAMPDRF
ncbi:2-amino-4-hydroxy-6-hydroxymethyldihydropteridine diphosphokinase [Tessaracoccus caeni]|uniref:2-amino-4-hydroxy-6- hydroxymethyldihydropteridine diphosphokinase n=1 Tax=Tessaracoccus caeni TaxID=3031239 RepID=UPI0023DBA805|nr:2-amino-4-hydroxy-6-hydroxymethyldihydropteridine diphosphokinase [Tessaracoccus caeni]MDF1487729.1 2-amino-4-hydroxy-6-hydroxymethyldihydropteridine diphosphokinase [Tessaracoccus caeni]